MFRWFYFALVSALLLLLLLQHSVGADEQTCNNPNIYNDDNTAIINDLIEWIRNENGIVDDRQKVVRNDSLSPYNVVATSDIPKDAVLLSIPWDTVLEPKDYSNDNKNDFLCETVNVVYREMQDDDDDDESDYGPFVDFLRTLTMPFQAPSGWSYGAKSLLTAIMGEYLQQWNTNEQAEVNDALDIWKRKCKPDKEEYHELKTAALLVLTYKTPNPWQDDQDWYHLAPFYNFYQPRVDDDGANTRFEQDNQNQVMQVIASRDLQQGESIHTPMSYGELEDDEERRFIHSGLLERRHWFTFVDPSAAVVYQNLDVKFDLDLLEDDNGGDKVYNVTWVDSVCPHSRSYDLIEKELKRIQQIEEFLSNESLYILHPMTSYERQAILAYTRNLANALSALVKTRHNPQPVTDWTQQNYTVAGVNLGSYNLADGVEQDAAAQTTKEEPYELFENFDIGDMIIGNENWKDMIEYRRQLDRPSLSFYVDKVARKRWLPTQGMPQAKQFVLQYGFELTEARKEADEVEALYDRIPDKVDYAAKPSHHSEGVSVWLVSHDTENSVTSFSSTARQLVVDEENKFDKMDVARALAEHLHAEATDQESLTLRRVKPGVVVEERFVEVDHYNRAPMEFNCFVIWGRLWVAQLNYIKGDRRKARTWLYRDGSAAKGKEKLPPELDYVDWPHVVSIAESLGRNKDMFRVDIFVGIPASSPSLQANRTREERAAAVEYAVNECEIYPTTNFRRWKQLAQDGARLWVAGYKMGNYRTIPNDEVPKEFVEKGSLSEVVS